MKRIAFLKLVRQIERKWGVTIDRDRWWPNFKGEPEAFVLWRFKQCQKQRNAPGCSQLALGQFVLESLPDYLQTWWREHHWNTWPLIDQTFVKPDALLNYHRVRIRQGGLKNQYPVRPTRTKS